MACSIRFSTVKCEGGKSMVSVSREDLLDALLTARASGTRSGCSVVSWQMVQHASSSQAWPAKQFELRFAHALDGFEVQLALPC